MALEIVLHNQDLDDLLVDVRDLNLGGQFILNGFTLPQSQLFKILVQENSSGSTGNIKWRAARVSDPDTASERSVEVSPANTVELSANFE